MGLHPDGYLLGRSSERCRLAHIDFSTLAYNGTYSDGHPSELAAYTCLHPDSYPSESLLKDGDLTTLTARSQLIMRFTLMAT